MAARFQTNNDTKYIFCVVFDFWSERIPPNRLPTHIISMWTYDNRVVIAFRFQMVGAGSRTFVWNNPKMIGNVFLRRFWWVLSSTQKKIVFVFSRFDFRFEPFHVSSFPSLFGRVIKANTRKQMIHMEHWAEEQRECKPRPSMICADVGSNGSISRTEQINKSTCDLSTGPEISHFLQYGWIFIVSTIYFLMYLPNRRVYGEKDGYKLLCDRSQDHNLKPTTALRR